MLPQLLILIYLLWHHPYSKFFRAKESNYSIQQVDLKAAKNLKNIRQTEWLGNGTLLIEGRGDVIVYNVDKDKIDLAYSSLPYIEKYYWTKCVSKYGVKIILKIKPDDSHSVYKDYFIPNPENPYQYKLLDTVGHPDWKVNDLDCRQYQRTPGEEPPLNYSGQQLRYTTKNNLFLTKHGLTKTYKLEKTKIFVTNENYKKNALEIDFLPIPKGFFGGYHYVINSDYDELQNEYLWYQRKQIFDQNPESERAKMRIWRVTPDLKLLETHDLPAGPWIYKKKYYAPCLYEPCTTFDRVKLKSENGQIFAQVYGRGVKWKHKGIYRLNDDLTAWIPVVTGDTGKDFDVTPDGCKIAFSGYSKSSTGYVNICSP